MASTPLVTRGQIAESAPSRSPGFGAVYPWEARLHDSVGGPWCFWCRRYFEGAPVENHHLYPRHFLREMRKEGLLPVDAMDEWDNGWTVPIHRAECHRRQAQRDADASARNLATLLATADVAGVEALARDAYRCGNLNLAAALSDRARDLAAQEGDAHGALANLGFAVRSAAGAGRVLSISSRLKPTRVRLRHAVKVSPGHSALWLIAGSDVSIHNGNISGAKVLLEDGRSLLPQGGNLLVDRVKGALARRALTLELGRSIRVVQETEPERDLSTLRTAHVLSGWNRIATAKFDDAVDSFSTVFDRDAFTPLSLFQQMGALFGRGYANVLAHPPQRLNDRVWLILDDLQRSQYIAATLGIRSYPVPFVDANGNPNGRRFIKPAQIVHATALRFPRSVTRQALEARRQGYLWDRLRDNLLRSFLPSRRNADSP